MACRLRSRSRTRAEQQQGQQAEVVDRGTPLTPTSPAITSDGHWVDAEGLVYEFPKAALAIEVPKAALTAQPPKAKQIPIELKVAKLQQASNLQLTKSSAARALQDTQVAQHKIQAMSRALSRCQEAFVGMLGPTPPRAPPPQPPRTTMTPPKAAPPSPMARRALRRSFEEAAGKDQ